jgi:hypothetical protein
MDKKHATFRLEPAIMKRLKLIAVEQDKTLTDLFLEGIEYLLKKYEKPSKK